MDKNNGNPKIRFNNSKGEWKTWIIGDILTEKYRPILIKDEKEYQLVTVKRRNEGVVSRGYLKGKDILVKNYFEVEEGDFIISKRQIIHGASGIIPKSLHKAVVSNEYFVATSNENISSEYLTLISKLPSMHKMFFLSSYGVDIEKMVFDVRDWKKRAISIPNINEQKRIIEYFNDLDNLILSYQIKHRKLIDLKKSMLEKMFPKDGADVPELRFKGFTNKWETRKIEELGEIVTGSTPSTKEKSYYNKSGIPWVTPTDISTNVTYSTERHLSKKGEDVARVVPKNTILVTCIASIGKTTLLGTRGSFNQQINGLIPNEKEYNPYFLYILSTFWSSKMRSSASSGIMQIVPKSEFSKLSTTTPCLIEQYMISKYFEKMDTLIDFHAEGLKKLKAIKVACFEKMTSVSSKNTV